jgi:hypothetical protein
MKSFFIAVFTVLLSVASVNASAQEPMLVVQRFVQMDVEGKRLSADGWREADQLFTHHSTPPQEKRIIVIAKHYKVSESTLPANAGYYLGYWQIGRLDSSLRLHPFASKVETRFLGKFAVHKTREGWKIEGSQPIETHLTPKAAIRYLTDMTDKSTDASVKSNASKSIAILKRYE